MSIATDEAERRYPHLKNEYMYCVGYSKPDLRAAERTTFVKGAEWQASREPTEAEIEAAAKILYWSVHSRLRIRMVTPDEEWVDASDDSRIGTRNLARLVFQEARKAVTA